MTRHKPRRYVAATGLVLAMLAGACANDKQATAAGPEIPYEALVFTITDSLRAAADTTSTGLVYIPVEEGGGRRPGRGSFVSVHYTGMFASGDIFDSSYPRGAPLRFVLGQGRVIAGWDEGIALMREGGQARLVIPPELAYGDAGAGGGIIPPRATLIFDVWVVDVD